MKRDKYGDHMAFTDLTGRQLGKRYEAEYVLDHYHNMESHACDYLLTVGVDMNPHGFTRPPA